PEDERAWITEQIAREKEAKKRVHSYKVWEALRQRDVVLLTLCYFFALSGSYGIAFWLPTIVKRLSGLSDLKVTLLSALPYVAAFMVQQVNGWHSDRTRERRWHATLPLFICAITLTGSHASDVLAYDRSEEHTSELQSRENLVCRLLLE